MVGSSLQELVGPITWNPSEYLKVITMWEILPKLAQGQCMKYWHFVARAMTRHSLRALTADSSLNIETQDWWLEHTSWCTYRVDLVNNKNVYVGNLCCKELVRVCDKVKLTGFNTLQLCKGPTPPAYTKDVQPQAWLVVEHTDQWHVMPLISNMTSLWKCYF